MYYKLTEHILPCVPAALQYIFTEKPQIGLISWARSWGLRLSLDFLFGLIPLDMLERPMKLVEAA